MMIDLLEVSDEKIAAIKDFPGQFMPCIIRLIARINWMLW